VNAVTHSSQFGDDTTGPQGWVVSVDLVFKIWRKEIPFCVLGVFAVRIRKSIAIYKPFS
jgi:hypothetical protein